MDYYSIVTIAFNVHEYLKNRIIKFLHINFPPILKRLSTGTNIYYLRSITITITITLTLRLYMYSTIINTIT